MNFKSTSLVGKFRRTPRLGLYEGLQPGDLAITTSGVHVLCYLGEDRWIQAEPEIRKVLVLNGRTDENLWFDVPVKMYRWRMFEGAISNSQEMELHNDK